MHQHQVVGVRRERSFRSRKSDHIVGVCTLEVLDGDGRFHDFDRDDDWTVENGRVVVDGAILPQLQPRCRYWALEEVVGALAPGTSPSHRFFTRHPGNGGKATVFSRAGWISTRGNKTPADNLHSMRCHPGLIACDVVNRCPAIPESAQPVVRGHGPDC